MFWVVSLFVSLLFFLKIKSPIIQPLNLIDEFKLFAADECSLNKTTTDSSPVPPFNVQVKKEPLVVRCDTCCETFELIEQLSRHIKEVHLVHRKCKACGIEKFASWKEFQTHHLQHVKTLSIKVERLGPEYAAAAQLCLEENKTVAKKSTTYNSLRREPIKLTLRLTNCRKAKAAEERFEHERRQSLEFAESRLSKLGKAMEELQQLPEAVSSRSSQPSPSVSQHASSPSSSRSHRYITLFENGLFNVNTTQIEKKGRK